MIAIIEKSTAGGEIFAPTSKSAAHRLIISAALAEGKSRIYRPTLCDDVLATIDCLVGLGAEISVEDGDLSIVGFDPRKSTAKNTLHARESGSTLRFLLPLALTSRDAVRFTGAGRLMSRPMSVYENICSELGLSYEADSEGITVRGPLPSVDFTVRGDISSQFITGLMLVMPLLGGDRRIKITTKIESKSYIDMTISAMRSFGIDASWEDDSTILVKEGSYKAAQVAVEGDYSGAAFCAALGSLHGDVKVLGLDSDSLQGDKIYEEYYPALKEGVPTLDISNCPDLGPILFTLAAAYNGATFTGTARLRLKESDRAYVMAEELKKFGAEINVYENSVSVIKKELHTPTEALSGHGDHRIVMSLAVLATLYGGKIEGCEAISKSYPQFFDDLRSLGVKITTI